MKKYVFMKDYERSGGWEANQSLQESNVEQTIPTYSDLWLVKNDKPGKWWGIFNKEGIRIGTVGENEFRVLNAAGYLAQTIDMTPTWSSLLPVYLEAITERKNKVSYDSAMQELKRMAALADKYAEYVKSQKAQGSED